ncbi:unnamed protein product [Aureobasidium pullulans]|nr:unnamed protein product [Aureobasidium pullulans]
MSATGTYRGTPKDKPRGHNPFQALESPSGIPRPKLESAVSNAPSDMSTLSASRAKQSKRDEIETDLNKKRGNPARARQTRKAAPGSVLALRPSQALQIKPNTTVAEAAQLMAAKREDCVLVTDDDDRIAGIFTAKDLAFRVVGEGIKANSITIAEIMTKNPLCAKTDTSATDALDLMVRKGFRHLPVMDENHDISGILDITKCFYDAMEKLERAYSSSRKLYDALEGVQAELGSSQPQQVIQYVEAIRHKMSGPTLETVLSGVPPVTVSVRTSVKEAAALMKANHTTAVLVTDQGSITGIFTSKDVVLRVIAAGLDPSNCSVVRVMTPHPDFAPLDMSIQSALRKMHDGHYLNLPVMSAEGEIVGMVDVLKLTYATLDQHVDRRQRRASLEQVLDVFRQRNRVDDVWRRCVMPTDSASHTGGRDSPDRSVFTGAASYEDVPFPFKFKAPSGRVHRLQVVPSAGMSELLSVVAEKLGSEAEAIGGVPTFEDGKLSRTGFALSYLDNEGDTVSITTDRDLLDAISLAQLTQHDKVDLFVHDPEKAPLPATLAPQPTLPSVIASESQVRERKATHSESDEESETTKPRRRERTVASAPAQEQLISGLPNELLLPGAIVTLAVAIIGVFAISRMSSK